MDPQILCMGCMADKGDARQCPHCGWIEGTQPDSPLHLPPRTILNEKYLLGKALGQGGFGITYLAWDLNLNLKLAIKEYFPQDLASRAAGHSEVAAYTGAMGGEFDYGLEKFLQEARTLAQFDGHPSIVSVRDFFRANGTAYIVMSYLDGMDFKHYVAEQGHRLPFDRTLNIIMPVLDALKEVHAVNILHRDISPDNIFIKKNGQVVLVDFGAARQAVSTKGRSLSIILKPGFTPEEQYRSKGVQGPWTDIYAIAATIYRAITGQMPPESLDRLAEDTLVPPSRLGVAIGGNEERALLKAMAVRAEERFQTVTDFQEALLGKSTPLQTPSTPPAEATWQISRDGARFGPYTWERMVEMAGAGNVGPRDLVWNKGMSNWQSAAQIPGLIPPGTYPSSQSGPQQIPVSQLPPPPGRQPPGPVSQQPPSASYQPGPFPRQAAPVSYQPGAQGMAAPKNKNPLPFVLGAGFIVVLGLAAILLFMNWSELFPGSNEITQPTSPGQHTENVSPPQDPTPGNESTPEKEVDPDRNPAAPDDTPARDPESADRTPPGQGWSPGEVIPPGGMVPPVEGTSTTFWSLGPRLIEFTVYNHGGFKMIVDYDSPETTVNLNLKLAYYQDGSMVYRLEDNGQVEPDTNRLTLDSDWTGYDLFRMGFHPGACTVKAIIDGTEIATGAFTVVD